MDQVSKATCQKELLCCILDLGVEELGRLYSRYCTTKVIQVVDTVNGAYESNPYLRGQVYED